jgi:hypothetical protein
MLKMTAFQRQTDSSVNAELFVKINSQEAARRFAGDSCCRISML